MRFPLGRQDGRAKTVKRGGCRWMDGEKGRGSAVNSGGEGGTSAVFLSGS